MSGLDDTVALLALFADPTRLRLLALLEGEELTVADLVRITEVPQSRVSTHLGKLRNAGLLRDRKNGASTLYAFPESTLPVEIRRIWTQVRGQLGDDVLESDLRRRAAILDARHAADAWPDEVAGRMERHYSPGRTWEALARGLVGLLRLGDVLDVGSGDGVTAQLVAPRARSVTCLDRSDRVLEAARRRLTSVQNVHFARGDMHELPFAEASFDQILHFHVLTYSSAPETALREASRVLRPGGDLVAVTLHAHGHAEVSQTYSQVNTGFDTDQLATLVRDAGLEVSLCDITSRERRHPHFEVVTLFARKPQTGLRVAS